MRNDVVDRVAHELDAAWAGLNLNALAEASPDQALGAIERFREACRSTKGLTPEQRDRLIQAADGRLNRVKEALAAGRDLNTVAPHPGEESLFSLGDHAALRSLILAAVGSSVLMSGALPALADPTKSPRAVIEETGVVDAADASRAAIKVDKFSQNMQFVEKWEGGAVDHPNDPGGKTNLGVTQKTLDAYRDANPDKGLPTDVFDLSRDQARDIYKTQYFDPVRGDDLPPSISLAVVDTAVNSGPKNAIRMLQSSLGVPVDGKLGPLTLEAVQSADESTLFKDFNDKREALYNRIIEKDPTQEVFKKGWLNRLNDVRLVGEGLGTASGQESGRGWAEQLRRHPATPDPTRALTDKDFEGFFN